MPYYLVPRNEIHQSLVIVEANSAEDAHREVHENGQGTEVETDYHSAPENQPEADEVEELTQEQAYNMTKAALDDRNLRDVTAVQYLFNILGSTPESRAFEDLGHRLTPEE
jgi:hypothetical protein